MESEDIVRLLVDETVKKWGRLDIVINNAGCYERTGAEEPESMDTYDYVMAVNLRRSALKDFTGLIRKQIS